MISKNQIKTIISLQQKKFRIEHNSFIVEGEKGIRELINSDFQLMHLYCTDDIFNDLKLNCFESISLADLKKISALSTPNNCLAVFKIPVIKPIVNSDLIVVLDNIRDPGNLGTIIRLCNQSH